MKNTLKISFSFFLLAAFLFVQMPFQFLHDHGHKVECAHIDKKLNKETASNAHFHEKENQDCFACSACIIKNFICSQSLDLTIPVTYTNVKADLTVLAALHYFEIKNSRGPPSLTA